MAVCKLSPDTEQAVNDPVKQLLARVRLPGDCGPGKIREILAAPDLGGILCVPECVLNARRACM